MVYSVAVAGASGYAGGELLRLLAAHPELEVATVTAHSRAGEPLVNVHPHLRSLSHLGLMETSAERLAGHDVVFLALPHGHSAELAEQLGEDTLVIDCGADHRLEDPQDWVDYYGTEAVPAWPYGMPELETADGKQRRSLRSANRIAVPGCNATAVTLAMIPGIEAGLVDTQHIVATLAVGPSGAGRTAKTNLLAAELMGNARPYSVAGHRHIPEIKQNWRTVTDAEIGLTMTPVLVPMSRGILATVVAPLAEGVAAERVDSIWRGAFDGEDFVTVLPKGQVPQVSDVVGSNQALIGVAVDERAGTVIAMCAIDNLGKGTAGAAVQSANIALGLDEHLGLSADGIAP
ncbi:N-acetyl-gamma-glutamyl-phosphate reductase [Agrococcus casei]|uniref:N-acetyl-gamma-glutamyl-phosphate reductase n=1 Tax=Agrococcus casei LMG 22410 TaxID=1255656 RepID=A0A1R4GJI8_9MICO|nr:N-acetyl-gamma-glutamyl-phosphate reductase [Agrococcus casei]SJM68253.1 N-acetyl-gamma-glutamyl-phosphate reductase [Agrococcus casei LMG 22410]